MLGLSFSPILDRDSYSLYCYNYLPKNRSINSFYLVSFYKSTKKPYIETYCHIWDGVLRCYLYMLSKLQLICRTISNLIFLPLENLAS